MVMPEGMPPADMPGAVLSFRTFSVITACTHKERRAGDRQRLERPQTNKQLPGRLGLALRACLVGTQLRACWQHISRRPG